jgi:hypothetical protein
MLALYLAQVRLAWTLTGDAVLSLWISGVADRVGPRRMLMLRGGATAQSLGVRSSEGRDSMALQVGVEKFGCHPTSPGERSVEV